MPAVLFYLLDRHAPLAMTKGSNCPSTHHSCHSRARGPRKYECICGVDKAGILYPFSNNSCHCEGVRSTLKTLAYDCGNPVQYVCGRMPAVLFNLLDRHAPLAMTKVSKWLIPHSLSTPSQPPTRHVARGPVSRHPSNGGELSPYRCGTKFLI